MRKGWGGVRLSTERPLMATSLEHEPGLSGHPLQCSLALLVLHVSCMKFSTANNKHQAKLNHSIDSIANMNEWTPEEEAANLKRLLSSVKNKAQFAKEFGVPGGASMLSQHQSGHRPIGLEAGKAYARGLGVSLAEISPRLALLVSDVPSATEVHQTGPSRYSLDYPADLVRIPLLANSGSMGPGNEVLDADYVVGDLSLSSHWINQYIKPGNIRELKFIHAHGESMAPTFSDGDVLLVDSGARDPASHEGVYVLEVHGKTYIKRVRMRMSGTLEVSSDNPTIKTVDELNGDHEVRVLGRVVWAWNGRKL